MNVDLSAEAERLVESLVSSGAYQSPGEVVVEGLRLLESRENLRAEVQAGIDEADAGKLIDAVEVFAEARKRIESTDSQQTSS